MVRRYRTPNVGLKLTAEEVAEGIVSRETKEPKDIEGKSAITYGVLDPAAFASDGGPSIAERMSRRPGGDFFGEPTTRESASVARWAGGTSYDQGCKGKGNAP